MIVLADPKLKMVRLSKDDRSFWKRIEPPEEMLTWLSYLDERKLDWEERVGRLTCIVFPEVRLSLFREYYSIN
jgi:hypothetical protein